METDVIKTQSEIDFTVHSNILSTFVAQTYCNSIHFNSVLFIKHFFKHFFFRNTDINLFLMSKPEATMAR